MGEKERERERDRERDREKDTKTKNSQPKLNRQTGHRKAIRFLGEGTKMTNGLER